MEAIEEIVQSEGESAEQRGKSILDAINNFMEGELPDDDMCLVTLNRA